MASLQESKIEDFAFEYLHSFYTTRHKAPSIRLAKDQQTKLGVKADGVISFRDADNKIFVSSVNTSISPTLSFLLTRHKQRGLSRFRFIAALAVLIGVARLCLEMKLGLFILIIPPVTAFAFFIAHSLLERKYLFIKIERMVDELKKMPANEQWIGLSISSLTFRNNSLARRLLRICKQRGIGLVTVGKRFRLVPMLEAKPIVCVKGDFLSYYTEEDTIRKVLQDESVLRVA